MVPTLVEQQVRDQLPAAVAERLPIDLDVLDDRELLIAPRPQALSKRAPHSRAVRLNLLPGHEVLSPNLRHRSVLEVHDRWHPPVIGDHDVPKTVPQGGPS